MSNEMNKREREALKAISKWPKDSYYVGWTPKSNERLQALGYVTIDGAHVNITMAGIAALAEMKG